MLYKENGTHGPNYPQPLPELIEDHPEWEVERIMKHSGKKNIQYQVKWVGYEDITWEPEDNLKNSPDLIRDYWQRIAKRTHNSGP